MFKSIMLAIACQPAIIAINRYARKHKIPKK